jgi:alcohol dehydrogenase (cytochrome c)
VFNRTRDRRFTAYDASTGKLLSRAGLNAAPSSYPVIYDINGRQYIAIVAGSGGPLGADRGSLTPELDNPAGGATFGIFKLPDEAVQR